MTSVQVEQLTSQITELVTHKILTSLNATISKLVVEAVQSCLPTALQTAVETAIPTAVATSIDEIMIPINQSIVKIKERVLALESRANSGHVYATGAKPTTGNSYSDAVKTVVADGITNTAKLCATPGVLTGCGEDIGIPRNYHIVVRKIPAESKYDEAWLKDSIMKNLPVSATIKDITRLKSKDVERLQRSHTSTFKVTINYNGSAKDLYKADMFPRNAEVKRFRFLREAKTWQIRNSTAFTR